MRLIRKTEISTGFRAERRVAEEIEGRPIVDRLTDRGRAARSTPSCDRSIGQPHVAYVECTALPDRHRWIASVFEGYRYRCRSEGRAEIMGEGIAAIGGDDDILSGLGDRDLKFTELEGDRDRWGRL